MFHKVMFSSTANGSTAGLVVQSDRVNVRDASVVSRLYPYTEARKMATYHVSPAFDTFDQAFAYVFPMDAWGNRK